MKRTLSQIMLFLLCFTSNAQTDVDVKKQEVNKIKKNPSQYLYVEVLDSIEDVAITKAHHYLSEEIDNYAAEQKTLKDSPNVVAVNRKQIITMPRGNNYYRAFAYIKKSDIFPADNAVVKENTKRSLPGEKNTESISSNKRQETIKRLLSLKQFSELESCLNQLKSEGKISKFGKQKTLGNLEPYVLIVYNRNGDIEAILSEGPQRVNLKSGKNDSVENYKERGALGVMITN